MNNFLDILNNGKTQFHVVKECEDTLSANDFTMLNLADDWGTLTPGKYMVTPFPSMLVAWVIGEATSSLRVAMAHTDFPALKLKTNPDIKKSGYLMANVEPYGGLITSTWFDRPLGLAGKVVVTGDNAFAPKTVLYDSEKPICIIPNLAPHLKKDKNADIDVQKELIPLVSMAEGGSETDKLLRYVAKEADVDYEDILDYDLYLYVCEEPQIIGMKDEFISSPRIDNTSSVWAITKALTESNITNQIAVGVFFDNEEIGSRSKQGADSTLLRDIIERIVPDKKMIYEGFNISVDVAHGLHPNYAEKSDVTNQIILGNGVALKTSASQRYVTDSEAGAVITALCQEKGIKLQRQVNRSGMAGGQTLGPIVSSYLPMKSVDMGVPVLAMHSARELMHRDDYLELVKLLKEYYQY
ncbi:MAG: M18 family aminopeptidase [Lachnospiraceae bacterium]|nr:M18 family aminopeptidase [Lachnospiraceae bacterium]